LRLASRLRTRLDKYYMARFRIPSLGGIWLRVTLIALVLVAGFLLIPNASAGTVVNLSDKHLSIEIPSGWTYERNASSGGVIFDLEFLGPIVDGFQPYGLVASRSWPGVVTDSSLYAENDRELDDIVSDPGCSSWNIIVAPHNTTINGMKANDMIVAMTYSGVALRSRIVIIASDEWNTGWKVGVAVVESQYATYSSNIASIVSSLTIEEKEATELSPAVIGGILLVLAVVVVVVVLLMLRRKKEPVEVEAQYQPAGQVYGPPPPTS